MERERVVIRRDSTEGKVKTCTVQRISTEGNRLPEVAETMANVVLIDRN